MGRAASALDDKHIQRTRYIHQVSLVAFSIMRQEAYSQYVQSDGNGLSLDQWISQESNKSPNFAYWSTLIDLEMIMCRFIRSIREGDFLLYRQVLNEM